MAASSLDKFDRRLLALVQHDATLSSEQLGAQLGLSASAVQRRLKRLRSTGVISATVAILEPNKIGSPPTFVVGVELERERPELLARLRAWMSAEEAVQQAYYVTGAADLLLFVVVPDIPAFDAFMARLMAENPNVRRFSTSVVLAAHKRQLNIPVQSLV
jgi:DNA-binding Lrp family transcriptional regulator